jgi:FAD-dependent oxidoreductase domain-containing protein 1
MSVSAKPIVIIGGSIMGSSLAYHLALAGHADRTIVIEPDPTYEWAAAPRSAGGVRLMHGLPENIEMSRYGRAFYKDFARLMDVDGEPGTFAFREYGYLYLVAGAEQVAAAEQSLQVQKAQGVANTLLSPNELQERFPELNVAGIDAGLYGPEDGFIDPQAAVQAFRRKARSMGVTYVEDRVVSISASTERAEYVTTASGERYDAWAVVNVAGAWAPEVAAMVGMTLPVQPLSRPTFYFELREPIAPMPLTKDPSGVSFRTEGQGFAAGFTLPNTRPGFQWDIGQGDHDFFESDMWPLLAHRVPAFENLKVQRAWSGHYAWNHLDGNTIIGPWLGGLKNFYVAVGFSGAGLQKAPAIGRALSELLLEGEYTSLDLGRLSYQRVIDNEPLVEVGFKA